LKNFNQIMGLPLVTAIVGQKEGGIDMTPWVSSLLGVALFVVSPTLAAEDIRKEPVHFDKGATSATIRGRITGYETVDYVVRAKAGQTLAVTFKTSNRMAYFNVLPPGSETALFVGSMDATGEHYEGKLPADGDYAIRVYQMRAAARRKESATYALDVSVTGAPASASPAPASQAEAAAAPRAPFDQTLALFGIGFHVTSPNSAVGNSLKIVPSGLAIDNTPMSRNIDGVVTGAEVADINADGSPEIYVFVTGTGPDARASLVAYSANNKKSLSEIYLPPLDGTANAKGYHGHDEMAVVETVLARRFPIYGAGDPPLPTGRTRQLQYKLKPGEAGWVLTLDRVVEY
jgi:hypothetical protein